jgi:hypothetical protein
VTGTPVVNDRICTGYDGVPFTIGDRVELSPGLDLWMQGAQFGTVHSLSLTPQDRVKVRMDHPQVRNLVCGPEDYFRFRK